MQVETIKLSDKLIYDACLYLSTPYFGPHLCACQGNPRRHIYMQGLVESQAMRGEQKELRILEIGSWAGGSGS